MAAQLMKIYPTSILIQVTVFDIFAGNVGHAGFGVEVTGRSS